LHDLFVATLQNVSSKLTPDDFLAWPDRSRQIPNLVLRPHEDEDAPRWERINNLAFQRMRDRVALWGVLINWVQVRDITLTPHALLDSGPIVTASPAATRKVEPDTSGSSKIATPQPA